MKTDELTAIDEALAAGEATAEDPVLRELQELGLLLSHDAPEPDLGFEARLGERVRAGFPRRRRLPKLRRPPLPVLAGAAALLLAVAVAIPLLRSDNRDEPTTALSAPAPKAADVERFSRGEASAPAAGRRIERSAALTIAAPGGELDRIADGVTAVADRHRGFVLRSSVTSGDEGTSGGSFDLRIPADELQPSLRELASLGKVRSRTQSGQDVTREYVTVSDRLEAARAERKSLLRRLERADTNTEAEAIRHRLDLVAAEIRGLRGQLRDLRLRTNYASVSVTLGPDQGNSGGGSGFGDAFDDFTGSLAASGELALRALGVALPLSLLALIAWWSLRLGRRRRRESALI